MDDALLPKPSPECFKDVFKMLAGEDKKDGQVRFRGYYSSTHKFEHLNSYAAAVAAYCTPTRIWTPDETWDHLESCVKAVADDDYESRELLTAKVFLGFHAPVGLDDEIPRASPKSDGSIPTLRDVSVKDRTFDTSILYRRAFCAPLFSEGGIDPGTFRTDRNDRAPWLVATALLEALSDSIRRTVLKSESGGPALSAQQEEPVRGDDQVVHAEPREVADDVSVAAVQSVLADNHQVVNREQKAHLATLRLSRSIWKPTKPSFWAVAIAVCTGAVIASIAAFLVWYGTSENEPTSSTEVETFLPSADDLDRAQDISDTDAGATCATRSFSSARSDAFTCLVANIVQDPCFLAGKERVVCPQVEDVSPNGERYPLLAARVVNTISTTWLGDGEIVGAEKASLTEYPWAFELDYRNEQEIPYRCQVVPSSSDTFKSTIFSCSATEGYDGGQTVVSTWEDAFVSGETFLVRRMQGVLTAADFQRTDPQWSVAIQLPGTSRLERVAITKAWF